MLYMLELICKRENVHLNSREKDLKNRTEGILILYICLTMQGSWYLVKYRSAIVGQISQDITEFEGVDERRTLALHKTAEFSTSIDWADQLWAEVCQSPSGKSLFKRAFATP
jgi:hypothetical protein